MVKLYTELSLEYPLLFSLLQLTIVYYQIKYCKNNYKNFTWKDLGISETFILSCGLSAGLIMLTIFLLKYYFNKY